MDGVKEDERQVLEVQRMEGIRLAFEILSWAMQDRRSALFFEVSLFWTGILCGLCTDRAEGRRLHETVTDTTSTRIN
jgi:hypothetical protein